MDAIYARQSVDKKDSISIETQIELCRRETAGNTVQIYRDKGYSGSNTKRPAFQEMLQDIQAGRIQRVIVYRLDRMSRSLLDFANLIDFLDQYHTSFVSTQEKFDTGTPMGRAMLSITMVFAQLERETIQIRIQDNYYARGEKGMYLGGPPPYGFRKAEIQRDGIRLKYLEIMESEAAVIRQLYRWYGNARMTLGELARACNEQGQLTRNGKKWSGSKIGLTLRNPIYVRADINVYQYYKNKGCKITGKPEAFAGQNGCYLYGKRQGNKRKYTSFAEHVLSPAPSEGLVEPELFLKCQMRLDRNLQMDNRSWGKLTWLTGFVKCAHCGYAAIAKSSNHGAYHYFYCSGKETQNCDIKTNLGSVHAVETAVEQRIFKIIKKYSSIQIEKCPKVSPEANRLKAQLQECRNQIDRLLDLLLHSDEITETYFHERLAVLDTQKTILEAELAKAAQESGRMEKQLNGFPKIWRELDTRQKGELARLLIDHIAINREEITVYWKHHFA